MCCVMDRFWCAHSVRGFVSSVRTKLPFAAFAAARQNPPLCHGWGIPRLGDLFCQFRAPLLQAGPVSFKDQLVSRRFDDLLKWGGIAPSRCKTSRVGPTARIGTVSNGLHPYPKALLQSGTPRLSNTKAHYNDTRLFSLLAARGFETLVRAGIRNLAQTGLEILFHPAVRHRNSHHYATRARL